MIEYSFDPNLDYAQGQSLMGLLKTDLTPNEDEVLRDIAVYVADGLNFGFTFKVPGELAVRSIVDYDALNPDLSRFPLLKVYRQTDTFNGKEERTTKCIISYCIAFPDQDKLPGILQWVAIAIDKLLFNYAQTHEHCPMNVITEERIAEYRMLLNELGTPVYAFLKFNFKIIEY